MRTALIILLLIPLGAAPATQPAYPGGPASLANRLHAALFSRANRDGKEVGLDSLDPLLFSNTRQLSEGESNRRAAELLDELLKQPPPADLVTRAVLQSDLWAVFDWANLNDPAIDDAGRRKLRGLLARSIRHLALDPATIQQLPDNLTLAAKAYPGKFDPARPEASFVPADLLDEKGPWVCVAPLRNRDGLAAPDHARFFNGRSAFLVFMNLPGGRAATEKYLTELSNVKNPITFYGRLTGPNLADNLPQFPAGTQVALVRRMMLMDPAGKVVVSPITQSLQLRVYTTVPAEQMVREGMQRFFEYTLDRSALSPTSHGLRRVADDEIIYIGFNNIRGSDDPFESAEIPHHRRQPLTTIQSCNACHIHPGIYSVNSFSNQNAAAKPDPHLFSTTVVDQLRHAVEHTGTLKTMGVIQGILETRE